MDTALTQKFPFILDMNLAKANSQSHNTTRESMPSQKNRNELMHIFPTRMCNVTSWRHSKLHADWLMTLVAGGWGELQRLLSLVGYGSTGGVCGRSLTEGKILFTGRQTCSLYLVLWLCGPTAQKITFARPVI